MEEAILIKINHENEEKFQVEAINIKLESHFN